MLPRVVAVEHKDGFTLRLTFTDGRSGEFDFCDWIVGQGPIFEPLEDAEFFRQVRADPESGTIVWPNGVAFCPDVLYHEITGAPLPGVATSRQA